MPLEPLVNIILYRPYSGLYYSRVTGVVEVIMRQFQLLSLYCQEIKDFTIAVEELSGFVSTQA